MVGSEAQVETDVDMLVSLVKEKGKISVEQAAHLLKIKLSVIQKWVDFLLEEGVLGVEYKFVTPYIYFNKSLDENPSVLEESEGTYVQDKEEFFEKASAKGLNKERINSLWKNYLDSNLQDIKDHFYLKARAKNISDNKLDQLWSQYYNYLVRKE